MAAVDLFSLEGRVAVITGGGGLLGEQHARALASAGAIPILVDLDRRRAEAAAAATGGEAVVADVTQEAQLVALRERLLAAHGRIDILVNNAANNPAVAADGLAESGRLETLPLETWNADIAVGLTGAFLCSRVLGGAMAAAGRGVIVNVASDLAVVAPDQRLYRREGVPEEEQPVKPVSYVVVKTGLLGLTRYLATYWAGRGVRVNALSPAGVRSDQPEEFVQRFSELLPLARMANADEYHGPLLFLCSDASSFMTGQNLVVDGGRTAW